MQLQDVRILLVTGCEEEARLMSDFLGRARRMRAALESVTTCREALARLSRTPYDAMLLDLALGEQDGLTLMRNARELGSLAPVILLAPRDDPEAEQRAFHEGAADYLVKGTFPADFLERIIRHATERSATEQELRRTRDALEERVMERTLSLHEAISNLQEEIANREVVEAHLSEAEERYRAIFAQAMDAIVLIDPDTGRFTDFNDEAFRQLGYTREEFMALRFPALAEPGHEQEFVARLDRVKTAGASRFEVIFRAKDGASRNVTISAVPILLRGRKYVLAIVHDFTERTQMENELRQAIVRLEQHGREKSDFVTNVSHELKTPLTSMMYGVRNLLKGVAGPLPDPAVRYLRMFDTECQRLVRTTSDILDMAKFDNHTLTPSPVTTPLDYLLRRCSEALRPQAEAAGVAVSLDFDPDARFVRCDPNMIQRVAQNLISNALKFTGPGGWVRIATRRDAGTGFARVTVTDNGMGIPPEALGRVTERYFRAYDAATGSGLGLSISKDILQLHGGALVVASPPPDQERGTEVSMTLPLAAPPLVLIADDDPIIQALLGRQLAQRGYRLAVASRGDEALAIAVSRAPDLILLDLVLQDMSGADVILKLKGSGQPRYIPIIAVTAMTLDNETSGILNRFSIPTLSKPWVEAELFDAIESALVGLTAFQTQPGKAPTP